MHLAIESHACTALWQCAVYMLVGGRPYPRGMHTKRHIDKRVLLPCDLL